MANSDTLNIAPEPKDLECGAIIHRGVKSSWLNTTINPPKPTRDAFTPRPNGADDDGLSAGLTAQAIKESLRKAGTVSLHVGRMRNLGLHVYPDPEDNTHALIVGVPALPERATKEEIARFEFLMAGLIDIARHHPRQK